MTNKLPYLCIMKCKACKTEKDISNFYPAKNKNGFDSNCKDCRNKRHYDLRIEKRNKEGLTVRMSTLKARELLLENKKFCPKCKKVKGTKEFSTKKDGSKISSHCRKCNKEMLKEYYATDTGKMALKKRYIRNKESYKDAKLKRSFGIGLSEYNSILKLQNGKCAICKKTEEQNGKMLAVDHCHITGKNRDLLCSSCNICIGFIEKNNLDFQTIINYLKKHQ